MTLETFEELAVPLGVLTTELVSQRGMLFNCGPIMPALLASTAIPGVLPPVMIDGVDYIDGGFTANVPMKAALQMGAKSVVVLDVASSCLPDQQPKQIADMMMTAIQSTLRIRVLVEAPLVAAEVPVLYLPSPCMAHGQVFDFDQGGALLQQAREDCGHFLATCSLPAVGHMAGKVHFHPEDLVCNTNSETVDAT